MSEVAIINEFNENLATIFDAINRIFSDQILDKNYWFQVYTLVYNHCGISPLSLLAESKLFSTATGRQKYLLSVGTISHRRIVGGQLYYNMEHYLINYVQNLRQKSDDISNEDLLQFYVNQWNKYRSSNKILHRAFSYLHRYWTLHAHNQGYASIYEIFCLSMLIWQEIFLKPISNRLTHICFNMIETERQNHIIIENTYLIKEVIDSYLAFNFTNDMLMWLNEELTTVSAVNMYQEWFEAPFLEDTKRFYQMKANTDGNEPVIEYITKIVQYLNEEEHRTHSYLPLSSTQSYLIMIEEILTYDHLNDICDEFRNILDKKDYEGLKRLFEPIKRMSITKKKLKPIIKDHIYQIGCQSIEEISMTAMNNSRIFVKTIVNIHERFSVFIQDIFLNDLIFVDAFNQACVKFINSNAMTNAGKNSSTLLAQYCNKVLQTNNTTLQESDFEKNLNDIMIVFNYIEDKDAFELWYRKFFSKRLINQQSICADYEEMIISKLKQACGIIYTSKLENMSQDINLSKDLMDQYQTYCKDQQILHTFHFSGVVLSSNSWILSTSKDFILPDEFQSVLTDFAKFYNSQHNGRKLEILSHYSTGELKILFTKETYILQVSTYQMIILLLFNESTVWTVEQIQSRTQMNLELLLANCHTLVQSKILICDNGIHINTTLRIAEDFRNNKIRINLNVSLKFIEQKDNENVHRTMDEDRKMVIQAAIVRIMKARQTLKHALLMQEVVEQLSLRFKPSIPVIKKCIDILIEGEYLERQSNEKDVLRYLA